MVRVKLLALVVGLLLVGAACQPNALRPPGPRHTPHGPPHRPVEGRIDALTYNVAGLPDALSGSNPEVNTPLIAPKLNAFDLVLLQESWRTPDPNPLAPLRTYHEILEAGSTLPHRSDPMPAPNGTDPLRPSAILSDGLNRFSVEPFGEVTRQRWTNCGEASADCLALKGFSMARHTLADDVVIDVYNLHMDAGRADFAFRGENVDELATFITANSAGNAVIVGGDFNLHLDRTPDGAQFAELLTRTGLTDVCTQLGCAEPNRIDKFLYRSSEAIEVMPLSWTNRAADFLRADGEPLSDHDPVQVEFAWRTLGVRNGCPADGHRHPGWPSWRCGSATP